MQDLDKKQTKALQSPQTMSSRYVLFYELLKW